MCKCVPMSTPLTHLTFVASCPAVLWPNGATASEWAICFGWVWR